MALASAHLLTADSEIRCTAYPVPIRGPTPRPHSAAAVPSRTAAIPETPAWWRSASSLACALAWRSTSARICRRLVPRSRAPTWSLARAGDGVDRARGGREGVRAPGGRGAVHEVLPRDQVRLARTALSVPQLRRADRRAEPHRRRETGLQRVRRLDRGNSEAKIARKTRHDLQALHAVEARHLHESTVPARDAR